MSAKPHNIGSPGSKAVAEYIQKYFQDLGYDSKIEVLYTLFSTPKERVLEMTGPTPFKASLLEPALKEIPVPVKKINCLLYNCWSADGDVKAEFVFVNYGLPDDYETLRQMGIDVKGKIVIANGRSWRGIKPKVAQENELLVVSFIPILRKMDMHRAMFILRVLSKVNMVYKEIGMDMPVYPGDPLTLVMAIHRMQKHWNKKTLPIFKIPVIPISYQMRNLY
jgi:N-acetylated-alpha-linked acidic dipeptidase